jgi:hypothetical protein
MSPSNGFLFISIKIDIPSNIYHFIQYNVGRRGSGFHQVPKTMEFGGFLGLTST